MLSQEQCVEVLDWLEWEFTLLRPLVVEAIKKSKDVVNLDLDDFKCLKTAFELMKASSNVIFIVSFISDVLDKNLLLVY